MEIMRLETIAALRTAAAMYTRNGSNTRSAIAKAIRSKDTEVHKYVPDMMRDAETFEGVSADLTALAEEAVAYRAKNCTRWITSAQSGLLRREVDRLLTAIAAAPAVLEYWTDRIGDGADYHQYHIRLVHYLDENLGEWRWATEYNDAHGRLKITDNPSAGVSDNEFREDAEHRYWLIAESMGAQRS